MRKRKKVKVGITKDDIIADLLEMLAAQKQTMATMTKAHAALEKSQSRYVSALKAEHRTQIGERDKEWAKRLEQEKRNPLILAVGKEDLPQPKNPDKQD